MKSEFHKLESTYAPQLLEKLEKRDSLKDNVHKLILTYERNLTHCLFSFFSSISA